MSAPGSGLRTIRRPRAGLMSMQTVRPSAGQDQ
jgi:hypothetical protein